MQYKFEQDTWKNCQIIVPTSSVNGDADTATDIDDVDNSAGPVLNA